MADYQQGVPQDELDLVLGKPAAQNVPKVEQSAPVTSEQYSITPEEMQAVFGTEAQLQVPQPAAPTAPVRSYWDALSRGVQRGVAQVQSAVPTLRGVYSEATGDTEGAEARFQEAQAINKAAPESMQDFKEISGLEDAVIWGIEKFGEQVPIIGTAVLSGGVSGLIGGAVARGLLSGAGARALATKIAVGTGGFAATAPLETAGIADELRTATGNYHPGVAVTGGLAAGLLELATPLAITRALFNGKQLASSVGKAALQGMVTEASTEAAQEAIAIAARGYVDPNFKMFSTDNGWRVLESAAAGAVIGGGISAGAQAISRGGEAPGSQRKVDPAEFEGWSERPISWLYDKVRSWRDPAQRDLREAMRANPELDITEVSVLLDTVGIDWIRAGAKNRQIDAIGRFIESKTSRYAHPLFPDRLLTGTDLEEVTALFPPGQNLARELTEVNQGSLTPALISAELKDAPMDPADPRVFVLPGTSRQVEGQLRAEYDSLFSLSPEAADAKYRELMNRGLRVVPSYGSSFIYTGDLKGRAPKALPLSGRTVQTVFKKNPSFNGLLPELNTREDYAKVLQDYSAVDLEKVPPGNTIVHKDGVIQKEKLIFPADMSPERKQQLLDLINTETNTNVAAQQLMSAGVYSVPTVRDSIIFRNGFNLRGATTTPITGPDRAQMLAKDLELLTQFEDKMKYPVSGEAEVFFTGDIPPAEREAATKAVREIERLLRRMKLPTVQSVSFSKDIRGTAIGRYFPLGPKIEVSLVALENFNAELYTLVHEFGHHVTMTAWRRLPEVSKQIIWNSYRRHVLALQQSDSARTRFEFGSLAGETSMIGYRASFVEYLTDQFTRWYLQKYIGMEELPRLFGTMAYSVMGFYDKVVQIRPDVADSLQPDFMMAKWMNWLVADRDAKPSRRLEAELNIPETHPLAERISALISAQLDASRDLFPSGWTLQVGDTGDVDNIAVAIGSKQTVIFGLSAWEFGVNRVIAHEAVHASRWLFTPSEWASLVEGAKKQFGLRAQVVREYASFYREQGRKNGLEGEELANFVEMNLEEEMVANMIEQRAGGRNFGETLSAIVDKLIMFLDRIARALRIEMGWLTRERIISDFFNGEIAARDQQAELNEIYNRWIEADNRPETTGMAEDIPEQVTQVEPGLWVTVTRERLPNRKVYAARYAFYTGTPSRVLGTTEQKWQTLTSSARGVGVVYVSHNSKGFEVDYVKVNKEFRRQGFAGRFYKYLEKDLKQAMKPSGILLEDGYKMWKARNPNAVRYHVFDPRDRVWLSPNYIKKVLELQTSTETAHYKELYKLVDPKAWLDPELDSMFKLKEKQRFYELGMIMARQDRAAGENVLTGGTVPELGFEQAMTEQMAASQAANEKLLELPSGLGAPQQAEFRAMRKLTNFNGLTPQQRKLLRGSLSSEADRIGWFSKKWWGIKQLAWVNPHIRQLQDYTEILEKWAASTEKWIARADQVARNWDSVYGLTQLEKDNLAQLLFYMTEMQYRSPQEVAQNVVRRPTTAELQNAFRAYKLGGRAQQLYAEIEGEFAAYLVEVERISIASIEREFARQRVNGQPSAAEQKAKAELAAEMTALRKKPYFPMVRFGEWTLTVRNPNNNNRIEAFYTFESQKERNSYIQTASRQWSNMDLHIGRIPENTIDFVGMPGPLLRRIKASLPGLTNQQLDWLDQFEHHVSPEGSFRKRWLNRKETPGYSLDAFRVFSNYFQMGSRYLSRLEFKDQAAAQIEDLRREARTGVLADSSKRQMIGDFMDSHLSYMLEPGRDWGKVKSLIAIWHLGFSPIAAAMNLTQMPVVTIPYLNAVFGARRTLGALSVTYNALKGSFGGIWRNAPWPGYEKGRQEMIAQGKIDAGQAPELGAYASANNLYKTAVGSKVARSLRTTAQASMWMFGKAERLNRELTYAMTFKLAMDNPNLPYLQELAFSRIDTVNDLVSRLGVTGREAVAIIAAREAIDKTHGIYAPWARPAFMRNNLAATILVFFQYVQMMLFAMRNNPGAVQHILMLTAMTGVMGLPGADDLDKIVEAVVRRLGWNWSPKNAIREYVQQVTEGTPFSKVGPDIVLHGISRYGFGSGLLPEGIGAPRFDVSANMSMGKLVPGLGKMAQNWGTYQDWSKGLGEGTQEVAGAGFGTMFSMLQFLANDAGSADWRKWEKAMPRALKAQSKAIRFAVQGQETDKSGAWFASFDWRDPDDAATLVAQFLGATPVKLSAKWEAQSDIVETVMYHKGRRKILYEQMMKAVTEKDSGAIADTMRDIDRYNAQVRKDGIPTMGINASQLRGSLQNRNRARGLKEQGLPAVRGEMPVWRKMQEQYPAVEWKKVK